MPEQVSARQQRLAREKAVYQYITALEQGDIDTIAALLQQVEHDPTLEQMIMEAHEEYAREDQNAPQPGQIAAIRYKLLNVLSEQEEAGILASRPPARTRRRRFIIQSAVAVLVICALIGSALLLFAPHQTRTGSRGPTLGTWKLINSPNPGSANNGLSAISADAANDAWAVGSFSDIPYPGEGEKTLIEHWNGFAWSAVKDHNAELENSSLSGVIALSPNDVWAVGSTSRPHTSGFQPLIEHWNGNAWAIVDAPSPANSSFYNIAAVSANDIWVVGGYNVKISGNTVQRSLFEHWDGRSWKIVPSPNVINGSVPGFTFLNNIAAFSANDVWAVGFSSGSTVLNNQTALIEHWNGTAWTVAQGANAGIDGFLYGITAVSADDVWAVGSLTTSGTGGDSQQALIEHWNGSSWSMVGNPGSATEGSILNAIAAHSANDIWAVGATGGSQSLTLIEHWDGHSWKTVNSPSVNPSGPDAPTFNNQLASVVAVPSSHMIWAVGDAANDNVTASPAPTPTQFSPVNSQTLIVSYGE